MSAQLENEKLLIYLLGFDRQNRNAMELFFKKKQAGQCVLVNLDQAQLAIVDIDRYGVADEWESIRQIKPDVVSIILSLNESYRTPDCYFVKKPVKIPELVSVLKTVRKQLQREMSAENKGRKVWDRLLSGFRKPEIKENASEGQTEPPIVENLFFAEQGYLLEVVKKAVKQANIEGHGIRLQVNNQGSIFIDPAEHWVVTDFSDDILEELCHWKLNESDVSTSVFADGESAKYMEGWRDRRQDPIDIDSFLWDLARWSFRGMLPVGTNLNQKISLIAWPDLPRLTTIPNAMRIAALWVACPLSLSETIDVLKIPKTDVYDFYSASHTLGLISLSESDADEHSVFDDIRPDQERRSLYLNILKRIKGQGLE